MNRLLDTNRLITENLTHRQTVKQLNNAALEQHLTEGLVLSSLRSTLFYNGDNAAYRSLRKKQNEYFTCYSMLSARYFCLGGLLRDK